jgi:hypothetical protein
MDLLAPSRIVDVVARHTAEHDLAIRLYRHVLGDIREAEEVDRKDPRTRCADRLAQSALWHVRLIDDCWTQLLPQRCWGSEQKNGRQRPRISLDHSPAGLRGSAWSLSRWQCLQRRRVRHALASGEKRHSLTLCGVRAKDAYGSSRLSWRLCANDR